MRIAFVGLPLAALLLAGDGHTITWAGICRKGALGTRRLTRILGKDRVRIVPDLAKSVDAIAAAKPDLLVSWFWTKKVPASVRRLARHGAIGVHPSLLPRHRGPDPTFWAIASGDAETGVTAHVLEDDYDTGAMLGKRVLRIDPEWNAWTLAKRLDRPSLALLRDVVKAYSRGEPPAHEVQDHSRATPAPAPTDEELELRWSDSAEAVVRRIRAAAPWPGAFTAIRFSGSIGEEVLTITRAKVTSNVPKALAPGEAFVRKDGIAVVRAADAGVELHGARLDDDEDETDLDAEAIAELLAP
ncbi:MAG: formyltransferase family protein [Labilithrix sp.]